MSEPTALATLRTATLDDVPAWGAMQQALWPDESAVAELPELQCAMDASRDAVALLPFNEAGDAIGFAETTLRRDYVNGTRSSPVGFLEGWYVQPDARGRGVGRALVLAVEAWARAQGCSELASDALIENVASHAAHAACGFAETERVVYFRKRLSP